MAYLDDYLEGERVSGSRVVTAWGLIISAIVCFNIFILMGSTFAKLIAAFLFTLFVGLLYEALGRSGLAVVVLWGVMTLSAILLTVNAARDNREADTIGWGIASILAVAMPLTAAHSFLIWGEFA